MSRNISKFGTLLVMLHRFCKQNISVLTCSTNLSKFGILVVLHYRVWKPCILMLPAAPWKQNVRNCKMHLLERGYEARRSRYGDHIRININNESDCNLNMKKSYYLSTARNATFICGSDCSLIELRPYNEKVRVRSMAGIVISLSHQCRSRGWRN